jgi:UDP-N-acetyl-2-amino-2-deoxyglucuronate dehydrogenase
MTDVPPVRIALIGCGRISRNHFDAIAKVDGLELAAVCDVIPERAREAGARFAVPSFESIDEMLASVRCDAVALCTPSGLHPKHGITAARAGKHVICEKPMAISLEDADALVSECDAAGVQLFVVKQNRLNPSIQLLTRAIDRGRFGRIYLANTTVRWTRIRLEDKCMSATSSTRQPRPCHHERQGSTLIR